MGTRYKKIAEVEEVGPSDQPNKINAQHAERMDGAFSSIICSAAIPCGLILLIAGALIGVVLGTHINRDEGHPELRSAITVSPSDASTTIWNTLNTFKKSGGNTAFFIDFNPSSLTAIATLTGKVVPYLSSSIMALVAFFAARRIIINSKDTNNEKLLSPHQLSILIGLLSGSNYTPLKDCVKHHIKSKQKWISPLPHAFTALAAVTALGIIIPLADTWFGITVTPATVATVRRTNQTSTFGRAFDTSSCSELTYHVDGVNAEAPCNLGYTNKKNKANYFLNGADEAIQTLDGLSANNYVWHYQDSKTGKYYYYIGDTAVTSDPYARDFQTTTLAVQTQCMPMTSSCLPSSVEGFPQYIDTLYDFNCSKGFYGSLLSNGATSAANYTSITQSGDPMAGISFSPDVQLSTKVNDSEFASFQNPLHFGAWSVGWQVPPPNDADNDGIWDQDPQIFYDYYWNYIWMLNCSSTVYDLTYSFVNGSIVRWNISLTSQDTGGLLSLPFVSGLPAASLCLGLAATRISNAANSTQLADQWADTFSMYAVALLAGSLESRHNTVEQIRNNAYHATRVPMVPLFFLLGLKLLYCLAVLILATAAWYYTNPQETQSVKERLTVKGLTAVYFAGGASHQNVAVKNVEELFQNTAPGDSRGEAETARAGLAEEKVAMKPTELGGWEFVKLGAGKVWTQVAPIIESEVMSQAIAGDLGISSKDAAEWISLVRK